MPGRVPRTPREGCPYSNRDVVGAVPYSEEMLVPIRRADHSDQSGGFTRVPISNIHQARICPGPSPANSIRRA